MQTWKDVCKSGKLFVSLEKQQVAKACSTVHRNQNPGEQSLKHTPGSASTSRGRVGKHWKQPTADEHRHPSLPVLVPRCQQLPHQPSSSGLSPKPQQGTALPPALVHGHQHLHQVLMLAPCSPFRRAGGTDQQLLWQGTCWIYPGTGNSAGGDGVGWGGRGGLEPFAS